MRSVGDSLAGTGVGLPRVGARSGAYVRLTFPPDLGRHLTNNHSLAGPLAARPGPRRPRAHHRPHRQGSGSDGGPTSLRQDTDGAPVPSHLIWSAVTSLTCGGPDWLRRCAAVCLTESGPRWPLSRWCLTESGPG